MASVIDNNIVIWDVGESGVKIVCNAVLEGKGKIFTNILHLVRKKRLQTQIMYTNALVN